MRIIQMWHRDMKWTNNTWKMVLIQFFDAGLPEPSIYIFKKCIMWEAQ